MGAKGKKGGNPKSGKTIDRKEVDSLKEAIKNHISSSLAKDPTKAATYDFYNGVAYAIRDLLIDRWLRTQRSYYQSDAKRVYYLSLEFLTGRTLGNSLINMGLLEVCYQALHELGYDLEEVREVEWDAGLGNGGLGRLAACFLDSLATLEIPSYGYGIHYEYGLFYQKIEDGKQVEVPDNWLRYGNPWEFVRPEHLYPVRFYGRVNAVHDENGGLRFYWEDTEELMAMACDTPIPGYENNHVINMRLWAARSTRDFDLDYFNQGDYIRAVESKIKTETISKVLYPSDHQDEGKELRLKQQYFLVAATFQDIIRRYKKYEKTFDNFANKIAVQLNDTHPALAIPELMRVLLDTEGVGWDKAWENTVNTFGYTNHTLLPEALERWPVGLLEYVLPRHMQIIYEINRRFLEEVGRRYPGDLEKLSRMSIIEEGEEKQVRMGHLAIVGSHSVNGVSRLHSDLLVSKIFPEFHEFYPGRFNNKTNGITPRRWLKKCNRGLSSLITENIGDRWVQDLDELKKLIPLAQNKDFQNRWFQVKEKNKERLAQYIKERNEIDVDPHSMFDVQVKRIHEYKRQLLNVLHVIALHNRIKANPDKEHTPRTVIFGGKAAPSYWFAKLIIHLVNAVGSVVNFDKGVNRHLKVVFLSNYRVSLAEKIIPAADLSEQISTAGKEASGTGNMKFALNGALTIGTLDGANIEIMEEVGEENIFIFGRTAEEIEQLGRSRYKPVEFYEQNEELKRAIDMIAAGCFSPAKANTFQPLVDSLLYHDPFFVLADFESYLQCQEKVSQLFRKREEWVKMSILNTANMGKFSSDRTIAQYAREIWKAEPVYVK